MATVNLGAPDQQGVWGFGSLTGSYMEHSPPSWGPGGSRWASVAVPQGTVILSAVLSLSTVSSNPGQIRVLLHDNAPSLTTGWWTSGTATSGVALSSSVNLTAAVQALVDRPGWSSGNALAIRLNSTGNHLARGTATGLTITYQDPVQYLDAAGPVVAEASVPPIGSVTFAVTTASPVVAVASVPVPDVVAPRSVTTEIPVAATASVPPGTISGTGDAPPLTTDAPVEATTALPVPALARTIPPEPPPIPWERLIEDPAYHAALTSRQATHTSRAEIISPDDAVLARLGGSDPTHPGALSGTVSCDGERSIRWECDLVLDNPDLMPRATTDLLHPLSHNRVRLWWGIRLADGALGEVPVGTFYPDLTPTSDDGGILGVRIRGSSAVAEVKRARWDRALDLSGMTVSAAIVAILRDRAPWATVAVTPTDQKVPSAYEPGSPGGDPWEDVEALAHAAGMVAFEDRMGVIRVEPRPTPGPPRATFAEGPGTSLVELPSVATDLDWVVNRVVVASASPDVDPPVTGVASDDDPSSPLWVGRGHLYVERVENAIITTKQAAETMARNILADRAPVVTVEAVVHPHPHLDPGDTVAVSRSRAGVAGDHTLVRWTLGLEPDDLMQITATTRKETF